MQHIFRIHSVVDVITNSSTVIYTQATESTIKAFKDLTNALLKIAGSDANADDLFEFSLEPEMHVIIDRMMDNTEFGYGSEWYESMKSLSWKKRDVITEAKAREFMAQDPQPDWLKSDYEKNSDIHLRVKSKNDDSTLAATIMEGLISTFNTETQYDG